MQHGLVVVPPPALTVRHTALSYMRGALVSPACIAAAVFMACVGLGYMGVLGALFAVLSVIAVTATMTRSDAVRRHLDQQPSCTSGLAGGAGSSNFRPSGPVRSQQYIELRALVEQIERLDSADATRFELQGLLDHFVMLGVRHQRCLDALRLAGTNDLPQAIPITDASKSKRRREIMLRRMKHREECLRRIDLIADELEAIDELIRLIAQRIACPALDEDHEREIERRLWELDEVDAALNQLSA